ncbi:MAG TPA: cytochrome C oxidase Cbb3 [Flavobacterium sp.]|nr:cytochrome C oxidase Cbb3 [Flavobacterium sp.]
MKINWATAIVIAFLLFMTFILYFVFKVQTDSKYDNELVTNDYYKKEQQLQGDINKQQNANNLKIKLTLKKTSNGILVEFPENLNYKKISGSVFLYRPSSQKLDFNLPISLTSSSLLIPRKNLVSGLWEVSVDWNYEQSNYLNKETIYY